MLASPFALPRDPAAPRISAVFDPKRPSRWSDAAFLHSSPVKLGVLVNPRARALSRSSGAGVRALTAAAGAGPLCRLTDDLAAVEPALLEMARAGVNVLAIAGGDGTLHHAINALARLDGDAPWRGVLLPLRGGTLDIVARSLGMAPLDPVETLRRFLARAGTSFGTLGVKRVPLLAVKTGDGSPRRGFVFGSEMVKNALEMYDSFGGGYAGLSRFLFEVARGFAFRGELWQREHWRLVPPPLPLELGEPTSLLTPLAGSASPAPLRVPYSAAIACCVDLVLEGGVRAVRRQEGARGFHARIITETRTKSLLGMIPALMREGKPDGVLDRREATALSLHGAYTLDGECFGTSTRPGAGEPPPLSVTSDGHALFSTG